jgi:hypothetical protein
MTSTHTSYLTLNTELGPILLPFPTLTIVRRRQECPGLLQSQTHRLPDAILLSIFAFSHLSRANFKAIPSNLR